MICFSDTDILLKLIQFRLMRQALGALGVTSEKEVYVTPEAASKCRNSRRESANFRRETLNETLNFLRGVSVISAPGDPDELELLLDVEDDMDAGETTLFLATRNVPDFMLLTGDKRALRSLTNNFLSQKLHNRHLGRVVCLESLLLLIIRREGFRAVHPKLIANRYVTEPFRKPCAAVRRPKRSSLPPCKAMYSVWTKKRRACSRSSNDALFVSQCA